MQAEKNYIGEKEVVLFSESGLTQGGEQLYTCTFSDDTTEVYPKSILDLIKTDSPSTASDVKRKIVGHVTAQVLAIFKEANIKISEVNSILDLVAISINDNVDRASNKLWKVEYPDQRTFLMVDEILKNGQ